MVEPFDGGILLKMLMSLGFILLLIGLCAWLIKRMQVFKINSHPDMCVLSSLTVGLKEQIVVVRVGETYLLLGVGSGGVHCLHEFDEPPFTDSKLLKDKIQFAEVLAKNWSFGRKKSIKEEAL